MRVRLSVCLLFGVVLFGCIEFQGKGFVVQFSTSGQPFRWRLPTPSPDVHTNIFNPKTKAIRFFLASDGYSTNNTVAELNAIRASFAQWQAIPGTTLKFEDAGLIAPGVLVNVNDNTNVIFWVKNSTFNGVDDMSQVLGLTYTSFDSDNQLYEADIALNGHDFVWFTDYFDTGQQTKFFVESTALHEIGHFLGLDHSPVGAATMFTRGGKGINPELGLSGDEFAWAQWAYAAPGTSALYGTLNGSVRMNGVGIFGPVVVAEDEGTGNIVSSTVTRTDGTFFLPAIPPGTYVIRVSPLDPFPSERLVAGIDISLFPDPDYNKVITSFLPLTGVHQTIVANRTNTLDFAVTSQFPPIRITGIRAQTTNPNLFGYLNSAASLVQGQQGMYVGVFSPDFDSTCTLTIAGDGLTMSSTIYTPVPFPGSPKKLLSVQVNVATNATPGLRTLVVRRGADAAYANGFLDITTASPDFNFDGLNDAYQRRYFPLFTAPAAAPNADPDGDGQTNMQEYLAGTDPTNALSLLKIESARQTSSGTTVTWQSDTGKHYQVLARDNIAASSWKTNATVIGSGSRTSYLDAPATNQMRFYRIQAVP